MDGGQEMIDSKQIRRGRGLLHWTAKRLAKAAGLRVEAVERAERSAGDLPLTMAHAAAIQRVMEKAGIEFTGGHSEARLKRQCDCT
jgi:hypothetical protein